MKHKIVTIILMSTLLTSCVANTPVETTTKETTIKVSSETTTVPTEETTVVNTTEETTTTETTEHNPVLTLKQIEFNGTLPDGEYFVTISSFDEDCSGAVFNVRGYWCMSEDEINNTLVGDTVIMGNAEYEITSSNPSSSYFGIECSDLWGTQKQRNGLYYIRGWNDEIYTYLITENYYMSFAPSIEIFSDVNIYGQEELIWNETTIGKESECAFKYNTPQEYARDANENGGTTWGCHVVVENGLVTKIYANPQLHQPWMSQKIWDKYHS